MPHEHCRLTQNVTGRVFEIDFMHFSNRVEPFTATSCPWIDFLVTVDFLGQRAPGRTAEFRIAKSAKRSRVHKNPASASISLIARINVGNIGWNTFGFLIKAPKWRTSVTSGDSTEKINLPRSGSRTLRSDMSAGGGKIAFRDENSVVN